MQNPLHPVVTTMPYCQMLYSFLLRLHPHHHQAQEVNHIDHRLTKGPIAQLFLLLRKIVLLVQNHPTTFTQLNLPHVLKIHYQFVRGMLGTDQWRHLLSILMPTLAMPTYRSIWIQVSHILESTLSKMTMWLNSSKSGTMREPSSKMTPFYPPKPSWKPRNSFLQVLVEAKGQMWKVPGGYRMKLPQELWSRYRNAAPSMTTAEIHNFKQLAWAYFSQFNTRDFQQAIKDTIFYSQLRSIDQYANMSRGAAAHFCHITTCYRMTF